MAEYYTVLTNKGAEKVASYLAGGPRIELTLIAVGDGGGASFYTNYTRPQLRARTSLVNQRWADALYLVEKDADNPAWVITEGRVPAETGGWYIREVGIFDKAGDLIAIGVYPETYKPVLSNGIGTDLTIRSIIEVGDATSVTITIDPSVVLATREWVDQHKVDKSRIGPNVDQIQTPSISREGFSSLKKSPDIKYFSRRPIGIRDQSPAANSLDLPILLLAQIRQGNAAPAVGTAHIHARLVFAGKYSGNDSLNRLNIVDIAIDTRSGSSTPIDIYSISGHLAHGGENITKLVWLDNSPVPWIALDIRAFGSSDQTGFHYGEVTGFVKHWASSVTDVDQRINALTWVSADRISAINDAQMYSRIQPVGRPGDQIGNNTAWHSGNTLIDSNGFIKQA